MEGGLPWWVFAALAFVAVEKLCTGGFANRRPAPPVAESLPTDDVAAAASRSPSPGLLLRAPERKLQMPGVNVSVPCVGSFINPCGDLVVPEAGLDIKTPFGTKHIPGSGVMKPTVLAMEDTMNHWVVAIVVIITIAMLIKILCCDFASCKKSCEGIFEGKMEDDEDDDDDKAAKEEEDKARRDPKSEDFIAPGNIYRLLAVLHPGILGISKWCQIAFKAIICAYMQLFIPYKIINMTLTEWKLLGIKSPLWFLSHAFVFVSMMAALLSLCNMFAGKCAKNIMDGCEANYYILSHKAPGGGESKIPEGLITAMEYFWCLLSMTINMGMSVMLQFAMFLKVATYTGEIDQVAVVAVALYFVFALDDKVMEADPELRKRYRRAVAKQTEEKKGPTWLVIVCRLGCFVLKLTVPFGLLGIALFSWKNSAGLVIGGDGITRV